VSSTPTTRFTTFAEFYPFYLGEHRNATCRVLHFVGSWCVLITLALLAYTGRWAYAWVLPVMGYGFAWVGHFAFEKNRPATFKHPLYSFAGDWVMWWQLLIGKLKFKESAR
jgi:hypothetical protein